MNKKSLIFSAFLCANFFNMTNLFSMKENVEKNLVMSICEDVKAIDGVVFTPGEDFSPNSQKVIERFIDEVPFYMMYIEYKGTKIKLVFFHWKNIISVEMTAFNFTNSPTEKGYIFSSGALKRGCKPFTVSYFDENEIEHAEDFVDANKISKEFLSLYKKNLANAPDMIFLNQDYSEFMNKILAIVIKYTCLLNSNKINISKKMIQNLAPDSESPFRVLLNSYNANRKDFHFENSLDADVMRNLFINLFAGSNMGLNSKFSKDFFDKDGKFYQKIFLDICNKTNVKLIEDQPKNQEDTIGKNFQNDIEQDPEYINSMIKFSFSEEKLRGLKIDDSISFYKQSYDYLVNNFKNRVDNREESSAGKNILKFRFWTKPTVFMESEDDGYKYTYISRFTIDEAENLYCVVHRKDSHKIQPTGEGKSFVDYSNKLLSKFRDMRCCVYAKNGSYVDIEQWPSGQKNSYQYKVKYFNAINKKVGEFTWSDDFQKIERVNRAALSVIFKNSNFAFRSAKSMLNRFKNLLPNSAFFDDALSVDTKSAAEE